MIAGTCKPQKFRGALGLCTQTWTAWRLLKEGGKLTVLDSLKLPPLQTGETVNLAGGASTLRKKPIMENIILRAVWNRRESVKAGASLGRAWMPSTQQRKFVELTLDGLLCRRDEP